MVLDVNICPLQSGKLDGRFYITAAEVADLVKTYGTVEQLLMALIPWASKQARPQISNYHVGAVAVGGSGAVYVGANLEFRNCPLFQSVHAEQFALVNALSHGETRLSMLAVSAAPCGHCRQFYSELDCADTITFMFGPPNAIKQYTLCELLPGRFKPADLLPDRTSPLLMAPQSNALEFTQAAQQVLAERQQDGSFQEAAARALEEATQAYAPYTRCPSGLSLITQSGAVCSGRYLESAAYNPSLPPLQAAVINAVLNGVPFYSEVTEVVLAELEGADVQHADTVQLVLRRMNPEATLTVLHVQAGSVGSQAASNGTAHAG